jgi:hypothetical protein
MKQLFFVLMTLVLLSISCSPKDNDVRDVQKEESFGEDDFRESDNYERTVPLEPVGKPIQ